MRTKNGVQVAAPWLTCCLALGCVAVGCMRVLLPQASAAGTRLGEVCAEDAACESGHCAQGVCCNRTCDGTGACNLAHAVGTCTQRDLGDTCPGNAQCPSGYCVDGVCCDGACEGLCYSCASGHCGLAPDNTDVRGQCHAPCTACFGGLCSPAHPGTNPTGTCGAGLACGVAGECQTANGAACDVPGNCAAGLCLGGQCSLVETQVVTSDVLEPDAYLTVPMALAVAPSGAVSLVVQQFNVGIPTVPEGNTTLISTQNVYYVTQSDLSWRGFLLEQLDECELDDPRAFGEYSGAVAQSVGGATVVFLSTAFPQCASRGTLRGDPGVEVLWTGASLSIHRSQVLTEPLAQNVRIGTPPNGLPFEHLQAAFNGQDELLLTWGFTVHGLTTRYPQHLWRFHLSVGSWEDPVEVSAGVYQWGPAEFLDGEAVVFWSSSANNVHATRVVGNTATLLGTVVLPCALSAISPLRAAVVTPEGNTPMAWVTGTCVDPADALNVSTVAVTFNATRGFGTPQTYAAAQLHGLWRTAAAKLSKEKMGLLAFSRIPGNMTLAQMDAQQAWNSAPISPLFLWGENAHALLSDYGIQGPLLMWSTDRLPQGVANPTTSTLSSRMFLWRPQVGP